MAIRLLNTLFDFPINTIIRDLSYDIQARLVKRNGATYDLSGGVEASVPTLDPNLTQIEKNAVLLEQLLFTNRNKDTLEPISVSDLVMHGVYDYNDLATATTAIVIPDTDVYVDLTNDGEGDFTNLTKTLPGADNVWDVDTDRFDFSDLEVGDSVSVRLDIEVTTTAPNQVVDIDLSMAIGSSTPYSILFDKVSAKNAGANDVGRSTTIYIGDGNTKDFPAKIQAKSDDAATILIRGWFIKVSPRHPKFEL